MSESYNIVILGGSFAGLRIAHILLAQILPQLPAAQKSNSYQVTIVTPSRNFFMAPASLRAVTAPLDDASLLPEFAPFFEKYGSQVQLVQAYATAVDFTSKAVTLNYVGSQSGSGNIYYDSLIIATGGSSVTPAFKALPHSSAEDQRRALRELTEEIKAASDIVIGGGGITAVELASDIKDRYPGKTVTIYAGKSGLVHTLPKEQRNKIKNVLVKEFNIVIKEGRVTAAEKSASGTTTLAISSVKGNDTTVSTNLYIPAVGVLPNTKFLPSSVLNGEGYVKSDDHLRVDGVSDVYVTGDASALSEGNLASIRLMTGALQETLSKELGVPVEKRQSIRFQYHVPPKSEVLDTFFVTLGSKRGVGMMSGYRVPSFIIRFMKSKDAGVGNSKSMINGSKMSFKLLVAQSKIK